MLSSVRLFIHVHIPSLFDLSCAASAPVICEQGRSTLILPENTRDDDDDGRKTTLMPLLPVIPPLSVNTIRSIPYSAFKNAMMMYAKLRDYRHGAVDGDDAPAAASELYHNSSIKIYKSNTINDKQEDKPEYMTVQRGVRSQVVTTNNFDTVALALILDHVDLEHSDINCVMYLISELCSRMDNPQMIISAISRFSLRLEEDDDYRRSMMSAALKSSPISVIRDVLMQHGGVIDITDLACVVGGGDANTVRRMLDDGDAHGVSPVDMMISAVKSGNIDVVKMLLEHSSGIGKTAISLSDLPLICALECSRIDICHVITRHKHINKDDPIVRTFWKHVHTPEAAEWVSKRCTIINNTDAVGAIASNGHVNVLRFLIERGEVTVPRDILPDVVRGTNPYLDLNMFDYLIGHDADIHARDDDGNTVLHVLPLYARYFVNNGADVNAKNFKFQTPLHLACLHCHGAIPGLLAAGGDITIMDQHDMSPIKMLITQHPPRDLLTLCQIHALQRTRAMALESVGYYYD